MQAKPVLQVVPPPMAAGQQAWPAAPHGPHVRIPAAPWQDRPVWHAVGPLFTQHGPPLAPQALHIPPVVIPPMVIAPTQTLPIGQMPPAQQAPPAEHASHTRGIPPPGLLHESPAPVQVLPAQQPPPAAPHVMQVCMPAMPWQDRPDWQRLAALPAALAQQAPPLVPQATHIAAAPIAPAWHTAPEPVQVPIPPPPPPPQHGSPTTPQFTVPPSPMR